MPKKGATEPVVVVFTTVFLAGFFTLLAGVCILALQAVLWLKNGFWTSELVGDFLPIAQHFNWKGAETLWNAFLDFEAFHALLLIGCATIVVTLFAAVIGSRISDNMGLHRIEPVKKFSSGRAPVESAPELEPVNNSQHPTRGWFASALPRVVQAIYLAAALAALWWARA